ncbi:hypothetical protein HDU82_005858 [Entophlyctis luteolus]|nr:hypothetical protein HDU82_005858 [Entophlyctis luteolus]
MANMGAYKDTNGNVKAYSRSDVQKVVNYAFARNIRVVPEFEVPGHAALFGHIDPSLVAGWNHSPWDGRNGKLTNTSESPFNGTILYWGTQYCNEPPCGQLDVRNPKAVSVYGKLVEEVGSWFPDSWLHVGHDEVNARAFGLIPESWDSGFGNELFPIMQEFTPKLVDILSKAGKTYVAWDEVTDDSVSIYNISSLIPKQDTVITAWSSPTSNVINRAAALGFQNIIVSDSSAYYLDCSPSATWCLSAFEKSTPNHSYTFPEGFKYFPGQWHNWTLIYQFDLLDGVHDEFSTVVKGGFGSLWTETIKRHNIDRYAFPRIAVIAERLWSYKHAPQFEFAKTGRRLERFRAALINEYSIDAADLLYLGNEEDTVFRPEYCDGQGQNSPSQKTSECCFAGEPLVGSDGSPPMNGTGFEVPANYCAISKFYTTDDLRHKKPKSVEYTY